jgi:hypothetical protein
VSRRPQRRLSLSALSDQSDCQVATCSTIRSHDSESRTSCNKYNTTPNLARRHPVLLSSDTTVVLSKRTQDLNDEARFDSRLCQIDHVPSPLKDELGATNHQLRVTRHQIPVDFHQRRFTCHQTGVNQYYLHVWLSQPSRSRNFFIQNPQQKRLHSLHLPLPWTQTSPAPPSVWEVSISFTFSSLPFITPTPPTFLPSLAFTLSVTIINTHNRTKRNKRVEETKNQGPNHQIAPFPDIHTLPLFHEVHEANEPRYKRTPPHTNTCRSSRTCCICVWRAYVSSLCVFYSAVFHVCMTYTLCSAYVISLHNCQSQQYVGLVALRARVWCNQCQQHLK